MTKPTCLSRAPAGRMLGPPFVRPDDPTGVVIAQPACVEHGFYPWRGTPPSCSSNACPTQSLIGRSWARALWRTRRIRLLGSLHVASRLASRDAKLSGQTRDDLGRTQWSVQELKGLVHAPGVLGYGRPAQYDL